MSCLSERFIIYSEVWFKEEQYKSSSFLVNVETKKQRTIECDKILIGSTNQKLVWLDNHSVFVSHLISSKWSKHLHSTIPDSFKQVLVALLVLRNSKQSNCFKIPKVLIFHIFTYFVSHHL